MLKYDEVNSYYINTKDIKEACDSNKEAKANPNNNSYTVFLSDSDGMFYCFKNVTNEMFSYRNMENVINALVKKMLIYLDKEEALHEVGDDEVNANIVIKTEENFFPGKGIPLAEIDTAMKNVKIKMNLAFEKGLI